MPRTRILLIDDYERFRRRVREALQQHVQWEIVGEPSDELDAVRQAYALRPDLVLLDLWLPMLNGMEVLRRIRQRLPATTASRPACNPPS